MYPMDFEEFLEAIGHGGTLSLIRNRFSGMKPMGNAEHRMVNGGVNDWHLTRTILRKCANSLNQPGLYSLRVCRTTAAAELLDVPFVKQLLESTFNGDLANVGTLLDQIDLFELSESSVNHVADAIRLGDRRMQNIFNTLLKCPIAVQHHAEKIPHKRNGVVLSL